MCGLQQNAKVLFAKCSALSNSRKFSPAKVSGYTVVPHIFRIRVFGSETGCVMVRLCPRF